MKTFYQLFILLFFSFLFVSCDPAQNMHFINKTDSDAKVKIVLNPKFENYRLKELAKNDSIVFNIKEKDTANIYFGMGTWDGKEVEVVVNSIRSLSIETSEVITIYKSKEAIKKFFEKGKEGFWWKTRIVVEIE
jgi:hypothetical protein